MIWACRPWVFARITPFQWLPLSVPTNLSLASTQVVVLDLAPVPPRLKADPRVSHMKADITDVGIVRGLVARVQPTCVFHLASLVDVRPIRSNRVVEVNEGGAVNVALACSACQVGYMVACTLVALL